jgi:hypothetical protein
VENVNIDLVTYGTIGNHSYVSYYLAVRGKMLAGTAIPEHITTQLERTAGKSAAATASPMHTTPEVQVGTNRDHPLPIKTGEDTIFVFLDVDKSVTTGYRADLSFPLGADYAIELKGIYGELTSIKWLKFNGDTPTDWKWAAHDYDVELNAYTSYNQIEFGLQTLQTTQKPFSGLSLANATVYFHIIAWNGLIDSSDSPRGNNDNNFDSSTQAITAGPDNNIVVGSNGLLTATVAPAVATQPQSRAAATIYPYSEFGNATGYHHQRKMFYNSTDGVLWCFWYDGANTIVNRSVDGGITWDTGSAVFSTAFVGNCSIWHNATDGSVYVVGDDNTLDNSIYVRKGTVLTNTINWGLEYTINVGSATDVAMANKVPFISVDSWGFVWVCANTSDPTGRYNCVVNRSTNREDLSAWNAGTNMSFRGVDANSQILAMVLPIAGGSWATGGDVYTIWYNVSTGDIDGRKYTGGSWSGSHDDINLTATGRTNNTPSAVADGSEIYMIFSDANGNIIYRHYDGTSWVVLDTINLDANARNCYPTLTFDPDNNELHTFWIRDYRIYYRKGIAPFSDTDWTSTSVLTDNTVKFNLTSVYKTEGGNITWIWTEGLGFPKLVQFDRTIIPEVPVIAIPILIVLIAVVINKYMNMNMRRRKHR